MSPSKETHSGPGRNPFDDGNGGGDYRFLLDHALDGVAVVQGGRLVYANHRLVEFTGHDLDMLLSRPFLDFIHPEDREFLAELHSNRLDGANTPESYDFRIVTASGETRLLSSRAMRVVWKGGLAAITFLRDITRERRVEAELKDHWGMQGVLARIRGVGIEEPEAVLWKTFLDAMVEHYGFRMAWYGSLNGGVITPAYTSGRVDKYLDGLSLKIREPGCPDARCTMSLAVLGNAPFSYSDLEKDEGFAAWREYALELGYRSNLALPFSVEHHVEGGLMVYSAKKADFPDTRIARLHLTVKEMAAIVAERRRFERWRAEVEAGRRELEHRVRERTLELEVANSRLTQEVAERRAAEKRIRHMALHDPLTGLPNRQLFHDRLAQALARGKRRGAMTALLFVDLDGFKKLNDTHGHVFGDEVLKETARRLAACVRESDTVSRVGGDEFVVILPDLEHPGEAERVAGRIVASLTEKHMCGLDCVVSASVGISLHPTDGLDMDSLISVADKAMYRAKAQGGGRFHPVLDPAG